jgi:hypothetical protein
MNKRQLRNKMKARESTKMVERMMLATTDPLSNVVSVSSEPTNQMPPLRTNNRPAVSAPLSSILLIDLPPVNGVVRTIRVVVSELGDVTVVCSKPGTTDQTITL